MTSFRKIARADFVVTLCCLFALAAPPQRAQVRVPRSLVAQSFEGQSFEVQSRGVTVRSLPDARSPRRGTVRLGSRLPVGGVYRGPGCPSERWVQVGDEAFVCDTYGAVVALAPFAEPAIVLPEDALLARRYGFVMTDGVWAYSRPSRYFEDDYTASLGRGFGIAIAEETVLQGVRFVRSLSGLWISASEVRLARGSSFAGTEIPAGTRIAFARARGASIYSLRGRHVRPLSQVGARSVVYLPPDSDLANVPRGYLRFASAADAALEAQQAIRERDWAIMRTHPRPDGVGAGEKWIDIDLTEQLLTAYEGDVAVFATLVSTGRAGPGHATPEGLFRVWAKLAEDTMDDQQHLDQPSNYAIEAVPWVQYFHEGIALHAAFWHDDFGRARSHGCVNLSPRDARRLFAWAGPPLPDGWDAIIPTSEHPGTWVHVHR